MAITYGSLWEWCINKGSEYYYKKIETTVAELRSNIKQKQCFFTPINQMNLRILNHFIIETEDLISDQEYPNGPYEDIINNPNEKGIFEIKVLLTIRINQLKEERGKRILKNPINHNKPLFKWRYYSTKAPTEYASFRINNPDLMDWHYHRSLYPKNSA